MAYVKIAEGTYPYEEDVIKAMYYIADLSKCKSLVYGGCNVISGILEDPYGMAEQFLLIQSRKKRSRRLYHVIVTLDYSVDDASLELADKVAGMVTAMYPDYQSVFVVHEDKRDYLHIHIIFNNCPLDPGKKNLSYYFHICAVRDRVEDMVIDYINRHH